MHPKSGGVAMKTIILSVCISLSVAAAQAQDSSGLLEAMSQAGGTAAKTAGWLSENEIIVAFDDTLSDTRARRTWRKDDQSGEMVRAILLNPSLTQADEQSVPYAASVLAGEAAELMLASFPSSAEKRYMIVAYSAETFIGLGGDETALTDEAWAGSVSFWKENKPRRGVRTLADQGQKKLSELEERALSSLDGLRRSSGEAFLLGAFSGNRNVRLNSEIRRSFLGGMSDGVKGRLETIREARKDYKGFKRSDSDRRKALAL